MSPVESARETVNIARIAAGGDGVGKLGTGVRCSSLALHQEISSRSTTFSFTEDSPAPDFSESWSRTGRTQPHCPHYEKDECGGLPAPAPDERTSVDGEAGDCW